MKFGEVCSAGELGGRIQVPTEFSDALVNAAAQARANREIGLFDYLRIKRAARSDRKLAAIYAGVCDEALDAGLVGESDDAFGFDWESILDFIGRLLDIILKLL